jgi:hypothetical protein
MKPRTFVRLFQARFAALIKARKKTQTISPIPKRMPGEGDIISLREWTRKPYRSKQVEIGKGVVTWVESIAIARWAVSYSGGVIRTKKDLNQFALDDGFEDWNDMASWFYETHGLPFNGILIQWEFTE